MSGLDQGYCNNTLVQVLGVDSEFCNVEAVVTGFVDMWPRVLRPRRKQFAVFVCVASFALGIPMCTQVGGHGGGGGGRGGDGGCHG